MKKSKYIMLHYLHNKNFKKISGSISYKKFENIVKKNLNNNYIYTFDDSLKSQFYLAKPILEKYKLKGIFFCNTFQFENKFNYHELSKFFIKINYKNKNNFYKDFFNLFDSKKIITMKKIISFKKKFSYYSTNEIKLRLIRSENLNFYNSILKKLFYIKKFSFRKYHKRIYMNKSQILKLSKNHIIGLHTHSHYFNFDNLTKNVQKKEIFKNKNILERLIKKKIIHFSYPIGKYNNATLDLLQKFKIKFAFKNNKSKSKNYLTIPRININEL
jgi:peptidoglycan/xylan/chitin deacetylase (PgdA/CDA1 family)